MNFTFRFQTGFALYNPEKELQLSRLADRDGRCVGADAIPSIVVAPAQRVLAPTSAVVRKIKFTGLTQTLGQL